MLSIPFFSTIGNDLAKSFKAKEIHIDPTFYRISASIGDIMLRERAFETKFKQINVKKAQREDNFLTREMKLVAEEFSPCIANF